MMTEQWYVGCCYSNQEKIALENLERQQFKVYLPMCVMLWAIRPRVRPLFPSYIFIKADWDNPDCAAIWSTRGISTILCSGTNPQPISSDIIDDIKAREKHGLVQLPPKHRTKFVKGDTVRVRGSPLDAIFEEVVDNARAALFISLLGQQKRIVVPITRLAAPGAVAIR